MQAHLVAALLCAVFSSSLAAQRTAISPFGTGTDEGNANNTIPFWSTSATYQQVHDYVEMVRLNGGQAMILNGIAFRADQGATAPARTLDVEITASLTPVTAATATTSFASNLGANPVVVRAFGNLNLPALGPVSVPNPPGWIIPWATPFPWLPVPGNNFIWQWRHRNASNNTWATLDAQDSYNATNLPNEGTGCVATGQNQPATVTQAYYNLYNQSYQNVLTRGAANAPSVFFMGVVRTLITLPGMCASLRMAPALTINGTTDGAGTWTVMFTGLPDLRGFPRFEVLGQFAFLDSGITPVPLGLSDMSAIRTPLESAHNLSRIYAGPYQGGGGYENATFGSKDLGFGLVAVLYFP